MSRSSVLIILGVFTILTPISGLPIAFRSLLTVLFGAGVLAVGLAIRTRTPRVPEVLPEEKVTAPPPAGVSPI